MLALTIETPNALCTTVGRMAFFTTSGAYKFTLAFVLVVAKSLAVKTTQRIWYVGLDSDVKPGNLDR